MDIVFTTFTASIEIFPYGILIEPSSKQSYHESPDEYPVPAQDRGYFFGSSSAYLMIDGCQTNPLILGATFTFRQWIRPEPETVGVSSTLLATSKSSFSLSITLSPDSCTFITNLSSGATNETILSGSPNPSKWSHIGASAIYTVGTTSNTIAFNGE